MLAIIIKEIKYKKIIKRNKKERVKIMLKHIKTILNQVKTKLKPN
jgi:hypothetical protein